MIPTSNRFMVALGLALGLTWLSPAHCQSAASAVDAPLNTNAVASGAAASAAAVPDADSDTDTDAEDDAAAVDRGSSHTHRHGRHGNSVVGIGHDSNLPAGGHADSVVSVLGSSTSAGEAIDVVSVLGTTRVTGAVHGDAVAVLGDTIVDGTVGGSAVAVLGNVELGAHADIGGDVVAVLGKVERAPGAVVRGSVQSIGGGVFGPLTGLHSWIERCLVLVRPLAASTDVTWAWGLALGFLVFYVCLALLFPGAVAHGVRTLEQHPGRSLLAALIALVMLPVLIVLLCITLVGIAAVPFVSTAFLCAALFGRAVVLAWLGTRLVAALKAETPVTPALAVLVGGGGVMLLYLVPVLGFVVFQLIGVFGLGAVVFALVAAARDRNERIVAQAAAAGPAVDGAIPPVGGAAGDTAAGAPAAGAPAGAAPPFAAAPAPVSASLPRAGFWIRMIALLIDVLLVGFVMSVLDHEFHLQLLVLATYGAVMWKQRGSTVGGIIFDLKVVRLDGRPLDWETAIVRALGCFLSLAVVGLGFFWIAFDGARQAWHDKIAGTVVVRVPKV